MRTRFGSLQSRTDKLGLGDEVPILWGAQSSRLRAAFVATRPRGKGMRSARTRGLRRPQAAASVAEAARRVWLNEVSRDHQVLIPLSLQRGEPRTRRGRTPRFSRRTRRAHRGALDETRAQALLPTTQGPGVLGHPIVVFESIWLREWSRCCVPETPATTASRSASFARPVIDGRLSPHRTRGGSDNSAHELAPHLIEALRSSNLVSSIFTPRID
jgi:hypothetical protein